MSAAGGLSPYVVLREVVSRAARCLREMKGGSGNSISELAKLPDEQLDRVTSLLKSAGDLAGEGN